MDFLACLEDFLAKSILSEKDKIIRCKTRFHGTLRIVLQEQNYAFVSLGFVLHQFKLAYSACAIRLYNIISSGAEINWVITRPRAYLLVSRISH